MMQAKRSVVRPRWSKVLADLWDNKTRTLLVVASIAVGVFAIGTIANAFAILSEDIDASYAKVNPANVTIITDHFDDEFLNSVKRAPGVADAEGRHHLSVSVIKDGEPRKNLDLVAINDFADSRIGLVELKEGRSFPNENELLIGFDAMSDPGYRVGDLLTVELADGTVRQLPVVGIVADQSAEMDPTQSTRGYVTHDSLEWLGESTDYERLLVTVSGDSNNEAHIESVATALEDKVERSGREAYRTLTAMSGDHPQRQMVVAILGVFGALGVLVMLLSTSLIFNTLNALINQNLRQIGVMKLIGARSYQILGMYLVLILLFGLIALLFAVPAAALAGYGLAWFLAFMMNASLQGFRFIPSTVLIQLIIALIVPLLAGFVPVRSGSKTKVRRAISDDRLGDAPTVSSLWHRLGTWMRWLSRPVVLSIRNTFRRKGRLLLTLFTLTVSGAIFIAVFNVRVSMQEYMVQMQQHFIADITLSLGRPYRISTVEQAALQVPGVEHIEAWTGAGAEVLDQSGNVVENLQISAPPAGSALIDPEMIAGRWLLPGDGKAIVVSDAIRDTYPDIKPGETLRLSVAGGQEEDWTLVGIFSFPNFVGDLLAYAPFEAVADIQNAPHHATSYRLVTRDQTSIGQERISASLDQYLRERGFDVRSPQTGAEMREMTVQMISILVSLLLMMAVLTAIVGSIGLTGTMGMNVLERTREIGVMRAIGAVDSAIIKSVVIEGAFIGLISWAVALPLSFPISFLLLTIISTSMQLAQIPLAVTVQGMVIWLGVVLVLTALASVWPARNAARLTIREVLAYE
ncbi:ABC transporter permease [Chloroflexota bacterium]